MTLRIVKVRMATKGEWDRTWSGCEYATYFQSREWSEIVQHYGAGEFVPSPYLLVFSDGSRAIFPITWYVSHQQYLSSPSGTYGGLISLDRINARHFVAALEFVRRTLGDLVLRFNPFSPDPEPAGTGVVLHPDETQVLNLESGIEHLFKRWTKGHKSATTKARREGVTVCVASSLQNWRDYYAMYQSSLKRWGETASLSYGWALFEEMYKRRSHRIKLWLALHEDQPVAGALCFYSNKHVVYWHGAAHEESFSLRPVQLLLYEAIRDAADRGFKWFDFNSSGGHAGVTSFKRGFGTIVLPCPWIELKGENPPSGWKGKLVTMRMQLGRYLYEHGL